MDLQDARECTAQEKFLKEKSKMAEHAFSFHLGDHKTTVHGSQVQQAPPAGVLLRYLELLLLLLVVPVLVELLFLLLVVLLVELLLRLLADSPEELLLLQPEGESQVQERHMYREAAVDCC